MFSIVRNTRDSDITLTDRDTGDTQILPPHFEGTVDNRFLTNAPPWITKLTDYVPSSAHRVTRAREAAYERIKQLRLQAQYSGMDLNGMKVDSDPETLLFLLGKRTKAKEDPTTTSQWKLGPGNFVTLDATTIIMIADAIEAFVQQCFDRESLLSTYIDTLDDPTVIDAVNWNTLVPSTVTIKARALNE